MSECEQCVHSDVEMFDEPCSLCRVAEVGGPDFFTPKGSSIIPGPAIPAMCESEGKYFEMSRQSLVNFINGMLSIVNQLIDKLEEHDEKDDCPFDYDDVDVTDPLEEYPDADGCYPGDCDDCPGNQSCESYMGSPDEEIEQLDPEDLIYSSFEDLGREDIGPCPVSNCDDCPKIAECDMDFNTSFEGMGYNVGELVAEKNEAYGNSFAKCGDFLRLLYPDGVNPGQYGDILALVRIFDKQMRIATDPVAFNEEPWKDIAGYGLLGMKMNMVE